MFRNICGPKISAFPKVKLLVESLFLCFSCVSAGKNGVLTLCSQLQIELVLKEDGACVRSVESYVESDEESGENNANPEPTAATMECTGTDRCLRSGLEMEPR